MSTSTNATITNALWAGISAHLGTILPILLGIVAGFIVLYGVLHWVYGKAHVR